MDDLDLDNPAWNFSLTLYARPGVAAELLALQDAIGMDVSLLLFCLWLGAENGAVLSDADIAHAKAVAAPWARMAVHPLRGVRRGIKASPDVARPAVASFRSAVQRLEIESERLQIALLFDWAARATLTAKAASGNAAAHNLHVVLTSYEGAAVECPHLIAALTSHESAAI